MSDIKTALQEAIPPKIAAKASPFITPEGEPRYWLLHYHYGNIPHLSKGFRFDGTSHQAEMRARKHCEILNLKFIKVRPMIVDLDFQEEKYLLNMKKDNYTPNPGIDL